MATATPYGLELHKSLQSHFLKKVKHIAGSLESAPIRGYRLETQKELETIPLVPLASASLWPLLSRSEVIFISDFHAADFTLSFVRDLSHHIPPKHTTLGLEFFSSRYQTDLDRFSKGKLSVDQLLLKSFQNANHWGVPLKSLKKFLGTIRSRGISIMALNHPDELVRSRRFLLDRELWERDQWAAGLITDALLTKRTKRCIAIFGEWHLGSAHLPRQMAQVSFSALGRQAKMQSVVLNSDTVFWRILKTGNLKSPLLRSTDAQLCVFNCAPWEKSASLLGHLEETAEEEFIHETSESYEESALEAIMIAMEIKGNWQVERYPDLDESQDGLYRSIRCVFDSFEYRGDDFSPRSKSLRDLRDLFLGLWAKVLRPLNYVQSKESITPSYSIGVRLAQNLLAGELTTAEIRFALFSGTDAARVKANLLRLL